MSQRAKACSQQKSLGDKSLTPGPFGNTVFILCQSTHPLGWLRFTNGNKGVAELESKHYSWGNAAAIWKYSLLFPRKVRHRASSMCPSDCTPWYLPNTKTYIRTLPATLLTIAKSGNNRKCPSVGEKMTTGRTFWNNMEDNLDTKRGNSKTKPRCDL